MIIRLVKDGIFPITLGKEGESKVPATGFGKAGTLQGEGKLNGIPSLFIRLSGCNLRCAWYAPDGSVSICDTPYSSHYSDEWDEWEIDDVLTTVLKNRGAINHIVITGGEPLLQAEAVEALASKLKQQGFHLTLETNATLFDSKIARHFDLFSMSPKLSSSIPFTGKMSLMEYKIDDESRDRHVRSYRDVKAVQKYIDACHQTSFYDDRPDAPPVRRSDKDFQLKFVVARASDVEEIEKDYLAHLTGVQPEDIILMPLGYTLDLLKQTSLIAAELAISKGWRFTPRLQIGLFGNEAGT